MWCGASLNRLHSHRLCVSPSSLSPFFLSLLQLRFVWPFFCYSSVSFFIYSKSKWAEHKMWMNAYMHRILCGRFVVIIPHLCVSWRRENRRCVLRSKNGCWLLLRLCVHMRACGILIHRIVTHALIKLSIVLSHRRWEAEIIEGAKWADRSGKINPVRNFNFLSIALNESLNAM